MSQETGICPWCNASVPVSCDRCPVCRLSIVSSLPSREEVSKEKSLTKNRKLIERDRPFDDTLSGIIYLGIDPGARYTGVVARDNDTVLHCSTLVRPKEMDSLPWALSVLAQFKEIRQDFLDAVMSIEGIVDPRAFHQGKLAPINPSFIMKTAAVAGACYAIYPESIIVPPGGNGKQHVSNYPDSLKGKRKKEIPGSSIGAGTRNHEQSAYDVAGKARKILELTKKEL